MLNYTKSCHSRGERQSFKWSYMLMVLENFMVYDAGHFK